MYNTIPKKVLLTTSSEDPGGNIDLFSYEKINGNDNLKSLRLELIEYHSCGPSATGDLHICAKHSTGSFEEVIKYRKIFKNYLHKFDVPRRKGPNAGKFDFQIFNAIDSF